MIVYPVIEVLDGKCVSLQYGSFKDPKHYDIAPLEAAQEFVAAGAEVLQVVDLDGVLQGGSHNADTICEIIETVGVPVQVAGGIRSIYSANWWFEHGAYRVVIGTAAVIDRPFLHDVCAQHPGRVVASIDAREGYVMIHGWTEQTSFTPMEVAEALQDSGIAAIIYTDIDMDDENPEATLAATTELATELNIPVISSGTVKSLDSVSQLQLLPNIEGCIIGRALFNKTFTLEEALEISRQNLVEPAMI